MTLPSLTAKYRSAATITQLKKLYSVTLQAMQKSVPEGDYNNIPVYGGGYIGAKRFYTEYLKPQFNISEECIWVEGCWSPTSNLDGSKTSNMGAATGTVRFTTSDGFNYNVDTWDAADYETVNTNFGVNASGKTDIVVLHVDANGSKKPNVLGKDVFIFVMNERGLQPAGAAKNDSEVEEECKTTGKFCLTNIIRNNWTINPEDAW